MAHSINTRKEMKKELASDHCIERPMPKGMEIGKMATKNTQLPVLAREQMTIRPKYIAMN